MWGIFVAWWPIVGVLMGYLTCQPSFASEPELLQNKSYYWLDMKNLGVTMITALQAKTVAQTG